MPLSLEHTAGRPANVFGSASSLRSCTPMKGIAEALRGRSMPAAPTAPAPRKSRREMDMCGWLETGESERAVGKGDRGAIKAKLKSNESKIHPLGRRLHPAN